MLSSCLRAAKVSSKVPFCDYDEETNSYVSLSRTAERNRHFATRSRYTYRIFYRKIAPRKRSEVSDTVAFRPP